MHLTRDLRAHFRHRHHGIVRYYASHRSEKFWSNHSPNAKMVLLPDNLRVPILINPDQERAAKTSPDALMRGEREITGLER